MWMREIGRDRASQSQSLSQRGSYGGRSRDSTASNRFRGATKPESLEIKFQGSEEEEGLFDPFPDSKILSGAERYPQRTCVTKILLNFLAQSASKPLFYLGSALELFRNFSLGLLVRSFWALGFFFGPLRISKIQQPRGHFSGCFRVSGRGVNVKP